MPTRLPPITKLYRSDLPGAPAWVDRILITINSFFEVVAGLLNAKLNVTSNLDVQEHDSVVVAGAAATDNTTTFAYALSNPPKIMWWRLTRADGAVTSSAVYVDWSYDGNNINVNAMTGLTSGKIYNIKFIVVGG